MDLERELNWEHWKDSREIKKNIIQFARKLAFVKENFRNGTKLLSNACPIYRGY